MAINISLVHGLEVAGQASQVLFAVSALYARLFAMAVELSVPG
jgi:hypothetical protein